MQGRLVLVADSWTSVEIPFRSVQQSGVAVNQLNLLKML